MLYKLEIENFFSIRDPQVLDLSIDAKVPDDGGRFAPIFEGAELRAPKVVAVYGANASGKTTILRALLFLVTMIRESVNWTAGFLNCERFADAECAERPIRVAIEFGGVMNLGPETHHRILNGEPVEHGVYRYELELEVTGGLARRIATESLRQRPNGQGKWQRVFERDADGHVKDSKSFTLSGYQHLEKTLAANHTVLSSFAKFQHPAAMLFVQMAHKVLFQIPYMTSGVEDRLVDYLKTQPNLLLRLSDELNRIDMGVEGIRFQPTKNGELLLFKHSGLEIEIPLALESNGTRAFMKMFPVLVAALDNGGIAVIDEMDAAIHPVVLPELLSWFHHHENRNKLNSQLWLSCHSASLLDDLEKEEIVLCEKDRKGRTRVYSLMDVKVRRDENHYRKYLSGAYGGVPHIG